MSCGGRVYKGDTVTISVPFDVDDYSNLTITYTTIGGEKIVKTQEEVEIEDGFITYTFEPGELDLLPDGVIYYTIECEVNGVPNVDSTNTNLYLKTPAGYSGRTAEDIYQEGYEAGLEDCSGSSCNLQSKSVVVTANTQTVSHDQGYDGMDSVSIDATSFGDGRYHQGYESGYDDGYEEAEEDWPSIQNQKNYTATTITAIIPKDHGFDAMRQVNLDATPVFNQGYQSGLTACSGETPCDCSSAITEAYQSGITEGIAQQKSLLGSVTFTHNNTFTNHSGWSSVTVNVPKEVVLGQLVTAPLPSQLQNDKYYIQEFGSGLTVDGWGRVQLDMTQMLHYGRKKQRDLFSAATFTENGVYTRENGWSAVTVDVTQCDCSSAVTEAWEEGYSSGSTDGWNGGYETGWQSGYTMGLQDCSGCSEVGFVGIDSAWGGFETYHPLGVCPFSEFTVSDNGYGQYKYDQGYVDGRASGYTEGYDDGFLSGASTTDCSQAISIAYDNGRYLGYNEGKDSVIKSLLTENDTDLVIGYYYTSARTMCLITGEYHDSNIDYDGNSAFVSMSVNGGSWQPVEKYLELPAGWSQVRFSGCTTLLLGAFSHRFTPSQQCDMDALKIVSLPTMVDGLSNTYTFHMNDGLRVIASSCGIIRGATNGADNINVVITHYTGNQREYNYFPSNGVLFIPEGSTADWASILPNWTHIEMF